MVLDKYKTKNIEGTVSLAEKLIRFLPFIHQEYFKNSFYHKVSDTIFFWEIKTAKEIKNYLNMITVSNHYKSLKNKLLMEQREKGVLFKCIINLLKNLYQY